MKEFNDEMTSIIQQMEGLPSELDLNEISTMDLYNSWKRMEGETDDAFNAFHMYLELPDFIISEESLAQNFRNYYEDEDVTEETITRYMIDYEWPRRKVAYLAYKTYLSLQRDKISEINRIRSFKNANMEIAEDSIALTMALCTALREQIEYIDLRTAKVGEISSLIRSLSTLGTFANDITTMALALDDIVQSLEGHLLEE